MRLLVTLALVSSFVLASEPSVFGAGNLNIPDPYGLTSEEKLILENKKEIQSVVQKNNLQSAKVETVTERLDGLLLYRSKNSNSRTRSIFRHSPFRKVQMHIYFAENFGVDTNFIGIRF